ncbi:putative phage protein (TIGR01671 family) [Lysinibacillus parviboronicapiens]|uniref:Phage protein (TIGR01671 family) n=1 Tax=Lysinibacillus parviboronicapiens TaxID=436516 RepID=A0ABV2PMP4_9BACI
MSREIKFRAWVEHSLAKYMDYEPTLQGDGILTSIFVNEAMERSDSKFMQYTGLKDKNGKEIYEGDIVDYLGDIDLANSNVLRVIEYKAEEACFVARLPIGVEGEEAVYLNEYDFAIIGNIYENPELLEATT